MAAILDLDTEIRRRQAQALLESAGGYGPDDDQRTFEPLVDESVVDTSPKEEKKDSIPPHNDWTKWETAPEAKPVYPTIAEDQPGNVSPLDRGEAPANLTQVERATLVRPPPLEPITDESVRAPDALNQVERATLVKPPAEAPDILSQVERAQLVKLPDTQPRGIITTPVEPITPQEPTQAPPQVQRAELIPAPQPTGPKAPGTSTQLAPPGKMDLRPDEVTSSRGAPERPSKEPSALPPVNDWHTWETVDGTPAQPSAVKTPEQPSAAAPTELTADKGNRVEPGALYSYLANRFTDSGLVGYVPPDGARWGIKTGSAAEWAAFGLAVAKQESDLNTKSYNASDPGGSAGLFQFGQGQTQFTGGRDQFDPQASADAFVRSVQHYVGQQGNISNLGATFGSIRRPNEAGQYIGYAQDVAAKGGAPGQLAAAPKKEAWEDWETLSPAEQATAEQAGQDRQKNTLAQLGQSRNIIDFYKSLDKDVQGVTPELRQQFQANLKPQIIGLMKEKEPGLTDDQAWAKATTDPNVLDVGADFWNKFVGSFQQLQPLLQQATGVRAEQSHLDSFLSQALPKGSDADKQKLLTELYALPPDQRGARISSLIPNPQTGVPGQDPNEVMSALDRLRDPGYANQQAAQMAKAQADLKQRLATDPRLQNTPIAWANENLATVPEMLLAAKVPPLLAAQVSQQVRDQLKAEHPEYSEDDLDQKAAYATLVQIVGQEAAGALFGAGAGAMMKGLSNPVRRAVTQALVNTVGGAAISGATQAGTNIALGKKDVGEGVLGAVGAGALQGGVVGAIHGAGEFIHPEAAATVARTEPPPLPPPVEQRRSVTASDILGPNVPDTSVPWYKPGPIVTRAVERGAFSPEELRQTIAEMQQQGGTPEQIRAAIENLQPLPDFTRQQVYFNEQTMTPTAEERQAMAEGKPLPSVEPTAITPEVRQREAVVPRPGNIGESEPWVAREAKKTTASGVANRYTAERIASGDLPPIDPNVGVTTEELLARGARMGPEEVNQHVSDLVSGKGGDLRAQAAAIRTEEARLTQRSRYLGLKSEKNPGNQQLKIDAENAYKDLADFHQGAVQKMKDTFHVAGIGLQGEPSVDLSTYNGLREKFFKEVGQDPPPSAEPRLRKMADGVRKTYQNEYDAMTRYGNEIEKQTARRKLPTAEETRLKAMEKMKDIPCPT